MVRNRELKRYLEELRHQLDLIERVIMVTNPNSTMAADAYDGLRKTILRSISATQALHAALADLDKVASSTDDIELIRVKLDELLAQYGIQRVTRYEDQPDAFERIGSGPHFAVAKPAYVTASHQSPVLMGVAESADQPPADGANATPTAAAQSEGLAVAETAIGEEAHPTEARADQGDGGEA